MQHGTIPKILVELYLQAITQPEVPDTERMRLAVLGLKNAFESDVARLNFKLPTQNVSPTKARHEPLD